MAAVLALVAATTAPAAAFAPGRGSAASAAVTAATEGQAEGPAEGQPVGPAEIQRSATTRAASQARRVSGSEPASAAVGRRAVRIAEPLLSPGARAAISAPTPARIDVPSSPVGTVSKSQPAAGPVTTGGGPGSSGGSIAFRGSNHVWIPALGISRSVAFFACSRNTALAHTIYRWGCAGGNNVYLMGHASSVFRPLHNAYLSGRLHKGMKVVYADGNGRVRTYAVSFWKVVRPDGDVAWAYAGQARPSLTLQTCVGANDSHRLVVRLVAVG